MRRYSIWSVLCIALLLTACSKQDQDKNNDPGLSYDDSSWLMGCLLDWDAQTEEYLPIEGIFVEKDHKELGIMAETLAAAKDHFLSMANEKADIQTIGETITWFLTDNSGKSQGKAVFSPSSAPNEVARLSLDGISGNESPLVLVRYITPDGFPVPNISDWAREMLEDVYYYGNIVDIEDHGVGSGKFVVIREFEERSWQRGMAIRMPDKVWKLGESVTRDHLDELDARSSSIRTMIIAANCLNADKAIMSMQLGRTGSLTDWNRRFLSDDRTWLGARKALNMVTGEDSWVSAFNPYFCEALIYWFEPQGDGIKYW